MRRIQIDDTDLTVSRISFGTNSLRHSPWRSDRLRVLEAALDSGITHFDTSPYYGFGLAETDLGHFLRGRRDRVSLASKIGLYSPSEGQPNSALLWGRKLAGRVAPSLARARVDWSLKTAEESLERTLKRCRRDFLDILFLHEPDTSVIKSDEFVAWLEGRRAAGCVRYWGLAGEAEAVQEWTAARHPLARITQTRDSLQKRQADFALEANRRLQFTYGYMSATGSTERGPSVYAEALVRNATGSVIMSTRRPSGSQKWRRPSVELGEGSRPHRCLAGFERRVL